MNIILLSGGSGKRLWPLSNDVRSKQFIRMLKGDSGYESMLQRVYGQIKKEDKDGNIVIATSKTQVSAIHNHLRDDVAICTEPERRNTYPAIALATYYIKEKKNLKEDDVVIVCPVDPYVESDYFQRLKALDSAAREGKYNITLMGVEPTEASEKFGYIIPVDNKEVSKVASFKEKPSREKAEPTIPIRIIRKGCRRICQIARHRQENRHAAGALPAPSRHTSGRGVRQRAHPSEA